MLISRIRSDPHICEIMIFSLMSLSIRSNGRALVSKTKSTQIIKGGTLPSSSSSSSVREFCNLPLQVFVNSTRRPNKGRNWVCFPRFRLNCNFASPSTDLSPTHPRVPDPHLALPPVGFFCKFATLPALSLHLPAQ